MLNLRDYQLKSKFGIKEEFKKGNKHVILNLPTGGGKTITFVEIINDTLNNGCRAMIVCDRKELIGQAGDKIHEIGLSPTIIAPGYKQVPNNVYLASVDTLKRRDLPQVDLVIFDEAHKQTFDNTFDRYVEFCDPYIIGATATPLRTGNQRCLSTMYDVMVEPVTVQELIDMGHLVTARTFAAPEDFSKIKRRGLDYDPKALFDKFNQVSLYDGVIKNYRKFANNTKALCFNVNVKHSLAMREKFREEGISAAHIDGKTPDTERQRIIKAYKNNEFKVLSNCSVLTTGYDEPSIQTVIVNRATLSLQLWLQMCGRGSRPFEAKNNFNIIDQGMNYSRHGLWEFDREWSLVKQPKKKGDGVAPVKLCDHCEAINHASATVCKVCGEVFPVKVAKLKQAEFVEIRKNIRGRGMGLTKPDVRTCTYTELSDYAKSMDYKHGWIYKQWQIAGRTKNKV